MVLIKCHILIKKTAKIFSFFFFFFFKVISLEICVRVFPSLAVYPSSASMYGCSEVHFVIFSYSYSL